MAGSLIKIDEEIVTSAVASVTLGGANWDSSYDVYKLDIINAIPDTDVRYLKIRVTEGGTTNSTSNYDVAYKYLKANASFSNFALTNQNGWRLLTTDTSATNGSTNATLYFFNMNSTTEYAFCTVEEATIDYLGAFTGFQGGGVFTVSGTARDGINIAFDQNNIANAKFVLYALKK